MRLILCNNIHALIILFLTALPFSSLVAQLKNDVRHLYPPFAQLDWISKKTEWQKNALAQQDSNLTLIGLWPWGPCAAVAARDHYAFISNGGLFQVFDISNPTSPQIIGELRFGGLLIYEMGLSGNFAYIVDGDMKFIDISQPTKPQLVAHVPVPSDFVHRITVSGNYAYLGTFGGQLIIVDISTPTSPLIKSTTILNDEFVVLMATYDHYLCIKTESPLDPIYIYDVADPTNPQLVGYLGVRTTAFTIADHYLYLCRGDSTFQIWDLTTPTQPQFVSRIKTPFAAQAVVVKDSLAYVTAGNTLLAIVNVSDVSQLSLCGTAVGDPGTSRSLAVVSPLVVASTGIGFWTIDVRHPEQPLPLRHFATGDVALNVKISDRLAFLASWKAGLFIVNISNPENPQFVTNFSIGGSVDDVAVKDTLVYIIGNPSNGNIPPQLSIVNVSQPNYPQMIAYVSVLPDSSRGRLSSTGLAILGNYVVVTHSLGLSIIDVSDKLRPRFVNWITTPKVPLDLAISGHLACILMVMQGYELWIFPIRKIYKKKRFSQVLLWAWPLEMIRLLSLWVEI
jgi:hypothetical protein